MRKKIVLITNIIAPNIISVFNAISDHPEVDLKVIFLAENETNRKWNIYWDEIKFNYSVLKSFCIFIQSWEMPIYFNFGFWKTLTKFKPDAICVSGYHYLVTIEALLYARINEIPITLWSESHLLSGFIKNSLADLYKKNIISRFDSYITCGTAAKRQNIYYGAKPEKIVMGSNSVDLEWFMKKHKEIQDNEISQMKRKYPSKNILYVGAFIKRKGVISLIAAFEKLDMANVGLILVGEGKEKDKYLKYIKEYNIKNVFFEGFVQKEDIVKYYKLADVFVLPSFNETWGLVVNEAMACGLPVLSSKYAGVTEDLVKEGVNGYSFSPNKIDELVEKLKFILSNNELREKMGAKSLEIIKDKTVWNYANKILEAIELALQMGGNKKRRFQK
ncbi:MAG: glycosyltransferase family 4 protein [Candidatus Omnitrophica bacterium]|nr:glycosyltransferase family 4 protein [Candidatus Omnitrophota bacterium]